MFQLRRALGASTPLKHADTLDQGTLRRVDALLAPGRLRKEEDRREEMEVCARDGDE